MKKIVSLVVAALVMCSCADSFLSEEPVGEFMPEQVESEENIEGIVIGWILCFGCDQLRLFELAVWGCRI